MNANDELKFVIGSREDYDWSKALIAEQPEYGKLAARLLATYIDKEV